MCGINDFGIAEIAKGLFGCAEQSNVVRSESPAGVGSKIFGARVANQRLTKHVRNGARQGELGFCPGAHFARVFTSGSYAGFSVSLEAEREGSCQCVKT